MGRRHQVKVELDDEQRAKLEWVCGRQNRSASGFLKGLLLAALAKEPDPPPGFFLPRDERD